MWKEVLQYFWQTLRADIFRYAISLLAFAKWQTVGVSNRQDIHFPFQVQRCERIMQPEYKQKGAGAQGAT